MITRRGTAQNVEEVVVAWASPMVASCYIFRFVQRLERCRVEEGEGWTFSLIANFVGRARTEKNYMSGTALKTT